MIARVPKTRQAATLFVVQIEYSEGDVLFNAELRYLVETFESAERGNNQNYRTLLDFSLGRINDRTAMKALGIDSDEDLFLLMAHAHLPMPRLSDAVTNGMVEELNALAGRA